MSDFIEWNSRLLRKRAVDLVDTGQGYGGASTILVYFKSGQTRSYPFNSIAERDRKFKELRDKLTGKWVEDTPTKATGGIYAPGQNE